MTSLSGGDLPLVFENTKHAVIVPFRGYEYKLEQSDLSTGPWITYDESKPQVWPVPVLDEMVPKIVAKVPRAGYVIDGGFAKLARPVLDAHGWAGLGRIVYATSSQQLGGWLADLGVSPGPVLPLAITQVVPGLVVAGPAPELAEQVRGLHRRFRSA